MGKFTYTFSSGHFPCFLLSVFLPLPVTSFPPLLTKTNADFFSPELLRRYAEKQVGYVACGVFLNEKDELLRLIINSVRNDLISRNEAFQCLALEFIANGKIYFQFFEAI